MKSRERLDSSLPARSGYLVWAEVVRLTSIHPSLLGELIELGFVEPVLTRGEVYLFREEDVFRLRKLERIRRDFEVGSLGATVIIDLLERVEHLERRVRELSRLL